MAAKNNVASRKMCRANICVTAEVATGPSVLHVAARNLCQQWTEQSNYELRQLAETIQVVTCL